MNKRIKFVLTSLILSLGFVAINFLDEQYKFTSIGILGIISLILFVWSLREGLGLNMTLVTLILPYLFTVSVGLFWFLLPADFLTRIWVVIFFGLGIYALCLTMNVYTVSAIRTIALLRAARGVGFILTLVTCFLIYDTILSLRVHIFAVSGMVFLTSLMLFMQGFWSIDLGKSLSKKVFDVSLIASLIVGEISIAMFFWPVSVVVGSLFFTVGVYILLGLGQAYLEGRLFVQTVRDYLTLGAFVFIVMFLATKWGV